MFLKGGLPRLRIGTAPSWDRVPHSPILNSTGPYNLESPSFLQVLQWDECTQNNWETSNN